MKDPSIQQKIKASKAWGESDDTILQIHREIWKNRTIIDPRLVYRRILGETGGTADPHLRQKGGSGYGLFQYTGGSYQKASHESRIKARYNKGEPPRLVQVKYYYDSYIKEAKEAADKGYGCNRKKKFADYTDLEKSSYLGIGGNKGCKNDTDLKLCDGNAGYRNSKACEAALPLLRGGTGAKPLCPSIPELEAS